MAENVLLRSSNKHPLDYIPVPIKVSAEEVNNLNSFFKKKRANHKAESVESISFKRNAVISRRKIFKNCVMRKLLEIRILKRKPKLGEMLTHFRKQAEKEGDRFDQGKVRVLIE